MKQLPSSTWLTDRHGFFIASISFTAQITWLQKAGETIKLFMTITNEFKQFTFPNWCWLCIWFCPANSWICSHAMSIPTVLTTNKTKALTEHSPRKLNIIYTLFFFFFNLPLLFQSRDISNIYVYRGERKESRNFWICH